jgi:hypothetical protein
LFDTNLADYLAFLCGQDKEAFVSGYDTSCADLTSTGFSTDASQLNLPSIAIAELLDPETIFRTVSNATPVASSYTATVEAPAGFDISVQTFDAAGEETEATTLDVAGEGGKASFAITVSQTETTEIEAWKFGAITWTDNAGHSVRLPLAIKAIPTVQIEVPELISGELNRGRFRFPVKMLYSGRTSIEHAGLVAPFGTAGNVEQDPDADFSFNEDGLGTHFFNIPEGTKVARFSLSDALVGDGSGAADLDMYVYRCDKWSCSQVASSLNAASNEDVVLTNPEGRSDIDVGDVYLVWIHGYNTADVSPLNYTMVGWIADQAERSTRVISSRRAINGRFNYTSILTRGLPTGTTYMGAVTYFNAEGEAEGTTVLELKN